MKQSSHSGIALVIVLSFLVIITMVVVLFLSTVTVERRAASGFQTLTSNRQLSDMVVSVVQSQIRQATTRGATVAWTSQPGMIQTFSASSAPGVARLDTAYKLYSSAELTVAGSLPTKMDAELAAAQANWTNPACYTDLNAPVTQADGSIVFPIVDPRAGILDSSGTKKIEEGGKVEGFSFSDAFGATTDPASPRLPMPVQWIYVLQDGSLVTPASTMNRTLTLPGATAANPAVGRIAYWTDDDSSKANINTASEGTYWDTPRVSKGDPAVNGSSLANATADCFLGLYQPAKGEFQRYPGHPATTSLSPILFKYMPSGMSLDTFKSKQYEWLPKYADGGSKAGTKIATTAIDLAQNDHALFASVDEMLFSPAPSTQPERAKSGFLSREALEQTRFFLTANSRAPEVNLFNLPRVSLWPVSATDDNNHRTPFDRLNLFCSTIGSGTHKQAFVFTRNSPSTLNADFSPRNEELFEYLNELMETPYPWFSANDTFASKYPSDYQQILVEIYDYVRLANLQDNSTESPTFVPFTTKVRNNGKTTGKVNVTTPGAGQVVPFEHPNLASSKGPLRGFGRFPMISEATVQFLAENQVPVPPPPLTSQTVRAAFYLELTTLAHGFASWSPDLRIRVTGLDSFKVKPVNSVAAATEIGFPHSAVNYCEVDGGASSGGHSSTGGALGLIPTMLYPNAVTDERGTIKKVKPDTDSDPRRVYPFVSDSFQIPCEAGKPVNFFFTGGTLEVIVEAHTGADYSDSAYTEVQRYTLDFPPSEEGGWPCPFGVSKLPATSSKPITPLNTYADRVREIKTGNRGPAYLFYVPGSGDDPGDKSDVIRSIEAAPPDFRLMAALKNVPAICFARHRNYSSTSLAKAHSITGSVVYPGASPGRLLSSVNYGAINLPNVSNSANTPNGVGVMLKRPNGDRPGDWDSGVALFPDGPWINKPDEGDQGTATGTDQAYPYYYVLVNEPLKGTLFSANRQLPSPGMLGSLPTGVVSGSPWQTLLFCPNPAAADASNGPTSATHPGFGTPHDHLLMDLFWVPITEPYAISDSFATAGKINLNAQILPFTNIKRETGLIAALKSTKIVAIANADNISTRYKASTLWQQPNNMRYELDMDATLKEIRQRYANNGTYLSASQICEVLLIPKSKTVGGSTRDSNPVTIPSSGLDKTTVFSSFWAQNRLTGDNLREKPYTDLYPRLTTKSNVYTVHYRVQSLKKVPGSNADGWDEARDRVVGEARGSATLERFIDPNDPAFNLAKNNFTQALKSSSNLSDVPTLDKFYKFRVVANREFRP